MENDYDRMAAIRSAAKKTAENIQAEIPKLVAGVEGLLLPMVFEQTIVLRHFLECIGY